MQVLLNCATSLDGRLAAPDGRPVRFSGEEDLRRVHAMRASCQAILVGIGTVLTDDPSLRVKPQFATGPDPLRVVLDTHARTPPSARVVDDTAPSLILHAPDAQAAFEHAETAVVPVVPGGLDIAAACQVLEDRGVQRLMVEGGARVLRAFLQSRWDAFTVYQAPVLVGDGPQLWPTPPFAFRDAHVGPLGRGALWTFSP